MPFDGTEPPPNAKVVELLRATECLLSKPRRWTKGTDMREGFLGIHKSYCLLGAASTMALKKKFPAMVLKEAMDRLAIAIEPTGSVFITIFNDRPSTTHADVLSVIRKAQELR